MKTNLGDCQPPEHPAGVVGLAVCLIITPVLLWIFPAVYTVQAVLFAALFTLGLFGAEGLAHFLPYWVRAVLAVLGTGVVIWMAYTYTTMLADWVRDVAVSASIAVLVGLLWGAALWEFRVRLHKQWRRKEDEIQTDEWIKL